MEARMMDETFYALVERRIVVSKAVVLRVDVDVCAFVLQQQATTLQATRER